MKQDKIVEDKYRRVKFSWENPTRYMIKEFRIYIREKLKIIGILLGGIHILLPGIESFDFLFQITLVILLIFIAFTYFLPYLFWKKIYKKYNKYRENYI